LTVLGIGCASPCEDDGLAQKGCPLDSASADGSGSASASATDTDSATMSDSVSAGTADGASATDTVDSTVGISDSEDLCPILDVDLSPRTPTVMLLVDQSGSMTALFGDGNRWTSVQQALVEPDTGIVAKYDDEVRFGLKLYTGTTEVCPALTGPDPTIDNFDAIAMTLADNDPSGETPTGDSVDAVTAILTADNSDGPKLIVLATDGEPDTCAEPNPQNGQEEAVAAVEAAFAEGIETRIISVGA
jgi:nitric oxide reductase activation protein